MTITMLRKILSAALLLAAAAARAQITIGVSPSAAGPGAALGIAGKNTIALLPKTPGGQAVRHIILDDATDPAAAGKGKPGSAEFRAAPREALENTGNLAVTRGVINMTRQHHTGLDERAPVLISIASDAWTLAQ